MLVLLILLPFNVVTAAERGVFKGKSQMQHELTSWEKNKIKAEFISKFSQRGSAPVQKLNANPWEARRAKRQKNSQKKLHLSNTWGGCREYAYKLRGQCYAKGGDAYTCERYYDARVGHCNVNFN